MNNKFPKEPDQSSGNAMEALANVLQNTVGMFVKAIEEKDISRLLILVIAALIFFLDPNIGLLRQVFDNPPGLYVFYSVIFLLICISIFLELRKRSEVTTPKVLLQAGSIG